MKTLNKSRSQKFNIYKNIKHRITKKDIENYPALSQLIEHEKRIRLEPLTNLKSNIIPNVKIRNEKKSNLIKSVISFRNIFQNYSKLNLFNDIQKIHEENNKFDKEYIEFKKRKLNNYSQKLDVFAEIKAKYKERNIKIPNISSNKSIFNPNVLILKDSDLYRYIDFNLKSFQKKKSKSLNYLDKIKKEVENIKNGNNKNNIIEIYVNKFRKKEKKRFESQKKFSSPSLEIENSKLEISKTKNTYKNLSNIDEFFGEKYNNSDSLFEKLFFKNKISRNNLISQNENNNIENETTCEKNSYRSLVKKLTKKTATTDGISDEEEKKKDNITNFIKLFPSQYVNRIHNNTSNTKKIILKFITPLERLYNKISSSDNQLKFNKTIKNYLKNRGINTSNDVSAREICKEFSDLKIRLFKKDFFNKDYELRKMNVDDEYLNLTPKQINKLKKIKDIKNQLLNSENKMVEIFCNYAKND